MKSGDAASRGAGKIPIFPSDGLELLLPGAPVPCPPSIYCIPSPRGQLPPFHLMTRGTVGSRLTSTAESCRLSSSLDPLLSLVCWQAWLCSSGASGKEGTSGLLLQRKEGRKKASKTLALFLNIRVLTILASPHTSPPPTTCYPLPFCPEEKKRLVLLQPKGERPQGVPRKERGWKTP